MKIRFRHKTSGKQPLSPTVGGILICLFMTAFTTVAIRQGGLNFGAVAIMAMFWIVGIAMIAQDVVAKQLSCESGRFTFRMPKARYEERIRWELRLQFKPEKGDFVDEHFRLPLSKKDKVVRKEDSENENDFIRHLARTHGAGHHHACESLLFRK